MGGVVIEEKERYEVISLSLNGYAYIHDFKTDNVLNTYDSCDLLNQQDKENQQLKQQLAEKDKEIGGIKKQSLENIALLYENATLIENPNDCNMMLSCLNRIKAGTPYIMQEVDAKLEKYDFAVEQLERVKSVINASVRDDHIIWDFDIKAHIDNQINELKGEK